MIVKVTTQAELNEALKNTDNEVEIRGTGFFAISGSSQVRAYGSSQVRALDSSQVTALDSSQVTALGSSQVRAYGSSQVTALGSSQVRAYGSSQVRAYGSSQVRAYGSSQVTAYGSSQVRALDSSQVTALDSSQVTALDSSQVRASDSSQVTALDSSQVTALGSSQVRAYGSSQVRALGSSQVRAYGSSQVRASKQVAVTKHGKKTKVVGGVQIEYTTAKTVKQWLTDYEVKVEKGVAILFKGVDSNFKSQRGGIYTPGTTPEADRWDAEIECGAGLHFSPHPAMTLRFVPFTEKFVACPVKVSELVIHPEGDYPDKAKAPRVFKPTWEVDINGNKIASK